MENANVLCCGDKVYAYYVAFYTLIYFLVK